MSTFQALLQLTGGRGMRLAFVVAGIEPLFQEAAADVPHSTFTGRTKSKTVQDIEVGEASIDLERRRMLGGSMRAVLLDNGTLADLFASRSRPKTYVATTTTTTSATITVGSTAGFPASGTIYIGAETITYTARTATTFTGCTRGQYGSRAQVHYGDADRGAQVYDAPPRWVGRRVSLYAYIETDNPDLDTVAAIYDVDQFRLEEAPVYMGNDRWELRCSHLSDEFAARQLGVNLRKADALPEPPEFDEVNGRLEWKARGVLNLFPTSSSGYWPTEVAIRYSDDSGELLRFKGSDRTTSSDGSIIYTATAGLSAPGSPTTSSSDARTGRISPQTLEHWAILQGGNPGNLALFALTSILGDGANGAYDVLPGCNRAATGLAGDEARFGAGIDQTEVDASAFVAAGAQVIPGWSYVIHKAVSVEDFLGDWCLAAQAFWFVDRLGQLTVQPLTEQRVSLTRTLTTDDVIGEPTLEVLEDGIYPRATVTLGLSPWSGDYLDTVTVIDEEMAARYPERQDTLQLESAGLALSSAGIDRPTASRTDIEMLVRRAMLEDGRGRLIMSLDVPMTCLTLELGDVVGIGFAGLPDYEGGDLNGRRARIIGRQPNFARGVVRLRLQVIEALVVVAPAAVIASVAGNVLTLRTTGPEVSSASPGNMFAATWLADICFTAGGASPVSISSVTATTVTLGAAPGGIVPGSDYIRVRYDVVGASVNGFTPDDFAWQQEATSSPITRFR